MDGEGAITRLRSSGVRWSVDSRMWVCVCYTQNLVSSKIGIIIKDA